MVTTNSGSDFLALKKIADFKYAAKDWDDSPVSNLAGWTNVGKAGGYAGLRIFNDDGSVTFSFFGGN